MTARRTRKPAPARRPARQKQQWHNLICSQETHQRIEELAGLMAEDEITHRVPSKHQAVLTAVLEAIARRQGRV